MPLESWNWFIQLAQSESFTRASEKLQISQQTLSSRLASLERELDTKLMVRSNPLRLTRSGEAFYEYALDQQQAYTHMMRNLGETSIGGAGELKVGISNVRGRILMPYVIRQFHQSLPGVRIKLIEATNEQLIRMAESNEADVVLARFDESHPGVTVRPLFHEEVVLALTPTLLEQTCGIPAEEAARKAEQEDLGILAQCPFLLETIDDISGRIAHVELSRAGIKPRGIVESTNMMTLLSLSAAGLGGVFCPTNMLDEIPTLSERLIRIRLSEAARYQISLGTPQNAEPWSPAQLFEDVIGALFGESEA